MSIIFEKITAQHEQIERLYQLLKSRVHTISHHTIPSYEEHSEFVQHHPYRAWYILSQAGSDIGSVYLTEQNTIGINVADAKIADTLVPILDKLKSEYAPLPAIKSVRAGHLSINVAPSNKALMAALEAHAYPVAQITYTIK